MPLFGKSPKFYFLKEGFLQTQEQGEKLETSSYLKIEELEDQRRLNLEEAGTILKELDVFSFISFLSHSWVPLMFFGFSKNKGRYYMYLYILNPTYKCDDVFG